MDNNLKKFIEIEMKAIQTMLEQANGRYGKVLEVLSKCIGKVVFIGVGKSGHIGKKLAATFSSTGTPSFFVHAEEAVHGDLGMIEKQDIAVLISNSGNTKTVLQAMDGLKKIGCITMAFTSDENSQLAKLCDYKIIYPKLPEADSLNLAPTVSSTMTLVLGDALACTLSVKKGFTRENFYTFHPSGALGEMLSNESK